MAGRPELLHRRRPGRDRRPGAFFLIRHHAGSRLDPGGDRRYVGSDDTGDVHEQAVRVGGVACRCITVRLFRPVRDGSDELRLLTNVPPARAGATRRGAHRSTARVLDEYQKAP